MVCTHKIKTVCSAHTMHTISVVKFTTMKTSCSKLFGAFMKQYHREDFGSYLRYVQDYVWWLFGMAFKTICIHSPDG